MLPFGATGQDVLAALEPSYYPPARTGLRGSHPGSYDHAHSRAWTRRSEWGPTTDLKEEYDLVVVGGGLSGLAAAYFYQQKHGKDKVLILDNHDDFGGHAKRNEHTMNGNTRLTYGGSQTLVDPRDGSEVVLNLLKDIREQRQVVTDSTSEIRRHGAGVAEFIEASPDRAAGVRTRTREDLLVVLVSDALPIIRIHKTYPCLDMPSFAR